jgi:hypothetical protein
MEERVGSDVLAQIPDQMPEKTGTAARTASFREKSQSIKMLSVHVITPITKFESSHGRLVLGSFKKSNTRPSDVCSMRMSTGPPCGF